MDKCKIGKRDERNWCCDVEIQNVVITICWGQGDMDNDEGETIDAEFFSGIEIENKFYELEDMKNGLKKYFPTNYQEIYNKINKIAEEIGLITAE